MATDTSHSAADAAAHGAEHSAGMPQLNFDTWISQIFWAGLAIILLYRLLSRSILPRISGALEDRHNAITDDLDRAAELKQKAVEAEETYNKALADARAKAQDIAAANRAESDEELAAATAEAEAEIAARASEGEERIALIREAASENAREIAREVASAIVGKVAPGAADDAAIAKAVDSALAAQGGS